MLRARYFGRGLVDVVMYTLRTGRWWLPLVLVALSAVLAVASSSQAAVPTAVYTLF